MPFSFLHPLSNIAALVQRRDVAALLKLLQRDDVRLRRDAIRALGDLRDPAAVPALTAILTRDQPRVSEQIEVTQALGKIADQNTVDALVQANAASIAREKVAIEEATAPSTKPYRHGFYINQISAEEFTLRSEIAQALSKIGNALALNALFDMLASESGWMESTARQAISQAIARMLNGNDELHARILLERAQHGSPVIRKDAAYYLRNFHGETIVKALMDVAWNEKEDFAIREAALGSVGKIAHEDLLDELDELARGANRAIARLAAQTAMEIRQRRTPNEPT